MKSIPALATIAALSAFILFSFDFATAGSVLFSAGLAGIMFADYARGFRPMRVTAASTVRTSPRAERLRLAA